MEVPMLLPLKAWKPFKEENYFEETFKKGVRQQEPGGWC